MAKRKTRSRVKAAATAARPRPARHSARTSARCAASPARRQASPARRHAAMAPIAPATPFQHARLALGQSAARRRLDRALKRELRQLAALRRSLRQAARTYYRHAACDFAALRRRARYKARLALHEALTGGAVRLAGARRRLRHTFSRKLRHTQDWIARSAEDRLIDAQRTMQRTFRPVLRNVAPYRHAALAGGTAALTVALISMGWLALYDQATAVPTREAARAESVGIASIEDDLLPKPMLGNIDLPPPAIQFAPPPAMPAQTVAVPLPPVRPTIAPAMAPRHVRRPHIRHWTSRAAREAHAEATPNDMLPSISGGYSLVAEARRYLGTNPTGRASLWCGAFMDMILRKTGHKGGGNLALGYEHYGTRVSGPEIGAIAVMGRRGGGHVGIVAGIDPNGNPILISGNHNHTVAEAVYPRSRIITYVMPN